MSKQLADEHLQELAQNFIKTCRDLGKNEHAVLHRIAKHKSMLLGHWNRPAATAKLWFVSLVKQGAMCA